MNLKRTNDVIQNINKRKNSIKVLTVYLAIFYFTWTIKELYLREYFHETISTPLLSAFIKSLIWILPAWLYIKYYLKLNVNVKRGVFAGLVLSLLHGLMIYTFWGLSLHSLSLGPVFKCCYSGRGY